MFNTITWQKSLFHSDMTEIYYLLFQEGSLIKSPNCRTDEIVITALLDLWGNTYWSYWICILCGRHMLLTFRLRARRRLSMSILCCSDIAVVLIADWVVRISNYSECYFQLYLLNFKLDKVNPFLLTLFWGCFFKRSSVRSHFIHSNNSVNATWKNKGSVHAPRSNQWNSVKYHISNKTETGPLFSATLSCTRRTRNSRLQTVTPTYYWLLVIIDISTNSWKPDCKLSI